ncbi:MAG: peptidase M23 [Gemmatimonadetes bacterium]|nr:MAG: peptidase M23 [Gemmatimonadota bacterium]
MPPLFTLSIVLLSLQQGSGPIDWKQVDRVLGRSGTLQSDVYRVGFPRADLQIRVGSVSVKPSLALGSWIALKQTGDSTAMLMGDLVLLEAEVGPVINALQTGGIEQTALHNHLLHESPHVVYLHIMGRGGAVALATTLHTALARTGTPAAPAAQGPPAALGLDTVQISQIIGAHGRVNGGVYQLSLPRDGPVMLDSIEVPPAMGVATAINFQATGAGRAAVTGDFVLTANEVTPVLRALGSNGIEVTALHSHMLAESPRLLFMHFWGEGDALALARRLRAAVDHVSLKRS